MVIIKHSLLLLLSICCIKCQYFYPNGNFQGYGNIQGQQIIPQGIPYNLPYPYQNAVGNFPEQQQQQQQQQQSQFKNIPTEIIDVSPEEFRQIMLKYKFQPEIVSYESRRSKVKPSFAYVVSTGSKKHNQTIIPNNLSKHEVKQNVFNKTFVLHPDGEKNQELTMNFVNGVQVTDSPTIKDSPSDVDEKTDDNYADTTVSTDTVTDKSGRRFIDVPEGCDDGLGFASTGGCFSPFKLNVPRPGVNTSRTRENKT